MSRFSLFASSSNSPYRRARNVITCRQQENVYFPALEELCCFRLPLPLFSLTPFDMGNVIEWHENGTGNIECSLQRATIDFHSPRSIRQGSVRSFKSVAHKKCGLEKGSEADEVRARRREETTEREISRHLCLINIK